MTTSLIPVAAPHFRGELPVWMWISIGAITVLGLVAGFIISRR